MNGAKIEIEIPGMEKLSYELAKTATEALQKGGIVSLTFGAFERRDFIVKCEVIETHGELIQP